MGEELQLRRGPFLGVGLYLQKLSEESFAERCHVYEAVAPRIVKVIKRKEKRQSLRVLPGLNRGETNEGSPPPVKKLRLAIDQQPQTSASADTQDATYVDALDPDEYDKLNTVDEMRARGRGKSTHLPVCVEPVRAKVHWDYLLEEMQWIHRVSQLEARHRRYFTTLMAKGVRKHWAAIHAKQAVDVDEKANILAAKKHHANIAKDISAFWKKTNELVKYGLQSVQDAKKKADLTSNLDALVAHAEKLDLPMSGGGDENIEAEDEDMEEKPKTPKKVNGRHSDSRSDAAKKRAEKYADEASQLRPAGNTLKEANVKITDVKLLQGQLREYQLVGVNWLYAMYEKGMNGILADEMGLGKTIQTIGLFAHLAAECRVWGPHLIVVPTSVVLNWEMEFKKWCPSLKVLTYLGTPKEREAKRKGWRKKGTFDVCITSYKLFTMDERCFKMRRWQYLVLDEAQNIKNFESQRCQSLINLRTRRRLLLTGTPLQNNLVELWALLHFLMPNVFESRDDFKQWFDAPITDMVEGNTEYNHKIVLLLHKVLRPFILRRLKAEVEKQLPEKREVIVPCDLSKRQRYLYNEFMSRRSTRESMQHGSLVSVLNIVMQLRKCCNHPNLFEPRQVEMPFDGANDADYLFCRKLRLDRALFERPDLRLPLPTIIELEHNSPQVNVDSLKRLAVDETCIPSTSAAQSPAHFAHRVAAEFRERLSTWVEDRTKSFHLFVPHVATQPWRAPFFDAVDSWWPLYEERKHSAHLRHLHSLRSAIDERAHINSIMQFPETRLIEYDCGKLQMLAELLQVLYAGKHRCLIFTQMAKMLDILEAFLSHHNYKYSRLDGSTSPEQRQMLMNDFNTNNRAFVFILSTRAGGVGVNLVGADTVIFYDSDWNPTMDAQAQDRCHRIGQTKAVTIYRLVSRATIEENILKKACDKRRLAELTIDDAGFTPSFAQRGGDNIRDLFNPTDDTLSACLSARIENVSAAANEVDIQQALAAAEDQQDVEAAQKLRTEIVDESYDPLTEPQDTEELHGFTNALEQLSGVQRYAVKLLAGEHEELTFVVDYVTNINRVS